MFPAIQRIIAAKAKDCIIAIKTLDQFGEVIAYQKLIIRACGSRDINAFPSAHKNRGAKRAIGGPITAGALHPAFTAKIERIGAIAAIQRVIAGAEDIAVLIIGAAEIEPVIARTANQAIGAGHAIAAEQRIVARAADQTIVVRIEARFDGIIARAAFKPLLREAANQRVLAIATIKELPGTGTGAQLVIAVFAIKLLEDTITGIKAIRATPPP